MIKPETEVILKVLREYLEANPHIRFTQALFNLNINQFADKENPSRQNYLLRDAYNDLDLQIVERLPTK